MAGKILAISPQLPDQVRPWAEKNGFTFTILHDAGNRLARRFNIVFSLPEELIRLYTSFGIDPAAANGDDTFTLPLAATYVIDRRGTIALSFIDADYTRRLAPEEIISVVASRINS